MAVRERPTCIEALLSRNQTLVEPSRLGAGTLLYASTESEVQLGYLSLLAN